MSDTRIPTEEDLEEWRSLYSNDGFVIPNVMYGEDRDRTLTLIEAVLALQAEVARLRGRDVQGNAMAVTERHGGVRETATNPERVATAPPLHTTADYGACYDCGRRYGDEYGFPDLVVPHDIWNKHISPTGHEGGLLCPSCMVRRAVAAGLTNVPARFTSGPFSTPVTTEGGEGVACRHCGHPWAALDGGDRLDDNGPIALVCDRCNRPWETTLSGGTTTSTPTPTETENG